MSADVTDTDRVTAARYWLQARYDIDSDPEELIAQAIADQRAAADDGLRARVEALIDDLDAEVAMNRDTIQAARPGATYVGRHSGLRDASKNAADRLRAALDPPTATHCTARHDVHEDGVTATWSCVIAGAHDWHADSAGRWWTQ